MNKLTYILFFFFGSCLLLGAQNKSIINDLNTTKGGQGKIVIYQDDAIKNLVGTTINAGSSVSSANELESQLAGVSENNNGSKNFVKAKGYRIQVFSGSDQKRSKNEAQSRKNAVQSAYPNMDVVVSYASPVWRVRAGNFKNHEQAQQALSEMQAKLSFGREMRIVEDVIKVAVN